LTDCDVGTCAGARRCKFDASTLCCVLLLFWNSGVFQKPGGAVQLGGAESPGHGGACACVWARNSGRNFVAPQAPKSSALSSPIRCAFRPGAWGQHGVCLRICDSKFVCPESFPYSCPWQSFNLWYSRVGTLRNSYFQPTPWYSRWKFADIINVEGLVQRPRLLTTGMRYTYCKDGIVAGCPHVCGTLLDRIAPGRWQFHDSVIG
jgi:hypothetical protein